jgi:hypothetical protein
MFKYNGSGRQFNSILNKNIATKAKREKKRNNQTRTQDVIKFGLKCLRLRNFQPLTIKIEPIHYKTNFYTCRIWSLIKMGCQAYQ